MRKKLIVRTIIFLTLSMFAATFFSACESDHHLRHSDYGTPGPGYEYGNRHDARDQDWDRNVR